MRVTVTVWIVVPSLQNCSSKASLSVRFHSEIGRNLLRKVRRGSPRIGHRRRVSSRSGDVPYDQGMADASRLSALRGALAARPGEPIPFDELAKAVWPVDPPVNPRSALRNLVQRLRRSEQVVTEPLGYRLVVRPPGPSPAARRPAGLRGAAEELGRALRSEAPVLAITGPPGVGKTSFAVRLAHRLREDYGDGQLHVNLRAFSPGEPVKPRAGARAVPAGARCGADPGRADGSARALERHARQAAGADRDRQRHA